MNYGFNEQREREHLSEKDWIFAGEPVPPEADLTPAETGDIRVPMEHREASLPYGVSQKLSEDTMDCATRGPLNLIETKLLYAYTHGMSEENRKWLKKNGYFVEGKIALSDRFNAVKSNTTREGNSMKAPLESIRKDGVTPAYLLPAHPNMTWDEYHDEKAITKTHEDLGKEFLKRFRINYYRVYAYQFAEALKEDMLVVALYAWPHPIRNEYPRVSYSPNHVVTSFLLPKTTVFDSYRNSFDGTFIKKLAPDYLFYAHGYRVAVSEQAVKPEGEQVDVSPWQELLRALKRLLLSMRS